MNVDRSDDPGRVLAFPDRRAQLVDVETVFQNERRRLLQFLRTRLGSDAEAQDAAQMTFLRLWQRRDVLHGENLVSLLFVTARNIARDMLRQRTRARSTYSDCAWDEVAAVKDLDAGSERILSARQELDVILELVEQLPIKCRMAFISYHFDQLTYSEISERMGITESMVRKYVIRAVAYCATRFEKSRLMT
jgi:RNA polymerase sigma-70 factor (ECF subfamily)